MSETPQKNGPNNLRGLLQDLCEYSDRLAAEVRETTIFAGTNPADAKTFMLISRHPRGVTELANALHVSRQAAHKSVQRLVEIGVVSYGYAEGSRRDMIATLTEQGQEARKVGLQIAGAVEDHVRQRIGDEDLETLRRLLLTILGDANSPR